MAQHLGAGGQRDLRAAVPRAVVTTTTGAWARAAVIARAIVVASSATGMTTAAMVMDGHALA